MATGKTNHELLLTGGRFSYLYVFEPYKGDNGDSFCGHFLLEPSDPQVATIVAAMKAVAQAKWPSDWEAVYAALRGKDKLALHLGDVTKPGDDAYKGKVFISANNKNRVTVVETRGGVNVQLTAADGRPRSGDYGNMKVAIWAQDGKFGKRINAQLMGVQYTRKGTPLGGGGRVASVEEFGVEPSDADSAEPGTATSGGGDVNDLLG